MTVLDDEPVAQQRGTVAELEAVREAMRQGPAAGATAAQHAKGKLTARERLALLFDDGRFTEVEGLRRHRASGFGLEDRRPYTDGVVTGWGRVFGRIVFAYAHDFRIFGGALGEAHATKIHKIMDMAIAAGAPLVSLNDGAGARIQEGVSALAGYGGTDRLISHAKQVISAAAQGKAYESGETVTRSADTVRLDDLKSASQELQRRELDARLSAQKRNLVLFIGAVVLAAGTVALWLALR